ncbi:MAG: hypothetical protein IJA30_03300 [Bacilli bacterium]|nr:hypothetical protein [Bacilli bacterium]
MKKRYENFENIVLFSILTLLLIFISIFFINQKRLITYKVFSAVYYDKNIICLVVSNDDVNLFFKNKKLFIDSNKISFEIERIDKDILKREGDIYSSVYIKANISNMYKINDGIEVSIMNKKINIFNMFKIIWEGD